MILVQLTDLTVNWQRLNEISPEDKNGRVMKTLKMHQGFEVGYYKVGKNVK